MSQEELSFQSFYPDASETIILLHGLLGSCHEWDHIIPHLSEYHILAVDLPAHSGSSSIKPFSIPAATSLLASLIHKHAHNGRAHVVGLSLGGYTARYLAKKHPELILSLFATGASGLPDGWKGFIARRPSLFYALNTPLTFAPDFLFNAVTKMVGIKENPALRGDLKANFSYELMRDGITQVLEYGEDCTVEVRTLLVAGGKQDDVEATRRLGVVLHAANAESQAVVVKEAIHAWSQQLPWLFARGVVAWARHESLPEEFEILRT
ncbi:MAG: hypothetical protein MMC23_005564 [Stictis urceolatum]|nr:hypothetical protein [Stictis urceolata]